MKINEISHVHFEHSCNSSCSHNVNWDNIQEVVSHYKPVVMGKVKDIIGQQNLTEATVKELKSLFDDDFLRQKERSGDLDGFRKFGFKGDTLTYYVPSSHHNEPDHFMRGKGYHCKIQFVDWQQLAEDTDLNATEASRLLFWVGNVKLSCNCPSQLYYGFNYLLDAIDAGIYPEKRKPVKMNPQERGIVCKHLRRLLDYLGANITDLATEVRNYRNTSPDIRQRELDNKKRQQDLITQEKLKQANKDKQQQDNEEDNTENI